MHQGNTATQQLKNKDETPTDMVHVGQINETTKLCLHTEEDWGQATSEYHDIGYIYNILSGP